MSADREQAADLEAVRLVLRVSGVAFPRGVLGTEARALADALLAEARGEDLARLVDLVAAAHWEELSAPIASAVRRARPAAEDPAAMDAFARASALATSPDPTNPLARALALRAGTELAAAIGRARVRVAALDDQIGDDEELAALALSRVAGATVVDLLELEPDDFGIEIAEYVDDDGDDAVARLARETGDEEIRAWARDALRGLDLGATEAGRALAALAAVEAPADPAEDVVWVAAILALVAEGLEVAAADSLESQEDPDPD